MNGNQRWTEGRNYSVSDQLCGSNKDTAKAEMNNVLEWCS